MATKSTRTRTPRGQYADTGRNVRPVAKTSSSRAGKMMRTATPISQSTGTGKTARQSTSATRPTYASRDKATRPRKK